MVSKYAKCIVSLLHAVLLGTMLFVLCAGAAQATLRASVDRNPISVDETVTLTLQSDQRGEDPDLAPLKHDFEIIGQSHGTSIQIINGQASQSVQWQISLAPTRVGQLVIPALSMGGQSSQPITLNVTPARQASTQQSGDLFVDITAEPHSAYVQQQIVVTVRLYRAVNLANGASLSDPTFPGMDASVQRIGEDREFQTSRNGVDYAVVERRYVVYAQKSGTFNSTPVVFDGNVIEARQGGGFFSLDPFNQRTRHVRIASKPLALSVKPVPPAFNGNQWLPTPKLQLDEQWSQDPAKLTAGEPVTRTITLQASGLPASVLPAIEIETKDGLKLYPDQPALKNSDGNVGTRTQKFALIPTRTGKLNLPAVEVRWWNTTTDKEEVAGLPAHEITVLPAAPGAAVTTPLVPNTAGASSSEAPVVTTSLTTATPLSFLSASWWPWLSLVLGLGWLLTLIAWWRSGKPSRVKAAPEPKQKPDKPSRNLIERELQASCLANDAAQARTQLLAWARQQWPDDAPNNLTSLARRCEAPLAEALNELDRQLYAPGNTPWRGDRLWAMFQQHQAGQGMIKGKTNAPLEPLYKH
jgi:hypothetical protein